MRRWVCSILCLLLFSCDNTVLVRACPQECEYPLSGPEVNPETKNIGICRAGKPVCDKENNVVGCGGQVLPKWEICDGLDNDCDGLVDEHMDPIRSVNWRAASDDTNPCGSARGACKNLWISCEAGWVCHFQEVELPNELSCDGIDNDCDGLVDENLFAGEFCYEVPEDQWWTASNEPCRPGIYQCVEGRKTCLGQILPQPEVCDFFDNDCNGVIDDTANTLQNDYDIVMLIDTSGSMMWSIDAVTIALDMYAMQFVNNPHYRFAIVNLSADIYFGDSEYAYIEVLEDFTDLSIIHSTLMAITYSGAGYESSYDAVYLTCDIENNPLNLSWREEAIPMIFFFSDEPGQSYNFDPELDRNAVAKMCLENGVTTYLWTIDVLEYSPIATATGGQHFILSINYMDIFNDLNSVIEEICVD